MYRKRNRSEGLFKSSALSKANKQPEAKTCHITLRKSTRAKSSKYKNLSKSNNPKGKSRRSIFKKKCSKSPVAVATPVTSNSLFFRGSYFQTGDIVSVVDVKDKVYYAQIRGLLQDQYCEKSAVITWLLPTQESPKGRFDPASYILGPEEDIPRKLECFEFVCHAPSEYYKANSPYPIIPSKPQSGFIWTRIGPKIVPLPVEDNNFDEELA